MNAYTMSCKLTLLYIQHVHLLVLRTCKRVHIHTSLQPERGWEVDLNDLESKIDNNTSAFFLNNPSNPCGSVYSRQHLLDILAVAERYKLPIISDEVYDGMVHINFSPKDYDTPDWLSLPYKQLEGVEQKFRVKTAGVKVASQGSNLWDKCLQWA